MKAKKYLKAATAFCLAIVLTFALVSSAFAEGDKTLTGIHDTYKLIQSVDIMAVYKAELHRGGGEASDVYYVACKGLDFTELDPSQPRSYASCVKIALSSENNPYLKKAVSVIKSCVPAGSDLVIVGHSLGGMVIQQVIANKEIKDNYNVLNTMSLGSPYILTKTAKEGYLIRIVDRLDSIPFMSIPMLANPYVGNTALETSFKVPVHFKSYECGSCWDSYDCLGIKNGGSFVTLTEQLYG